MSRKKRKIEKEVRMRREAEAKVNAEEQKKAEREAQKKKSQEEWDAKSPSEKRNTYIGCGVVVLLVIAIIGACSAMGGDDDKDTSSSSSSTDTEVVQEDKQAETADSPIITGLPLPFAEEKNDIEVDAEDFGPHIVDDVDHQRGIFDQGNWRVVAYCPQMVDDTVKVGAIKQDEWNIMTGAGQGSVAADNTLHGLLDCP